MALDFHKQIFAMIEEHNIQGARKAMKEHLDHTELAALNDKYTD